MKKKIRNLIILLLLVIAASGIFVVFKYRPDIPFIMRYEITHLFGSMPQTVCSFQPDELEVIDLSDSSGKQHTYNDTLMLINDEYQLDNQYQPILVTYNSSDVQMSPAIVNAYSALAAYISSEFQTSLYIRSSYRSASEQEHILEETPEVAANINASEHQTGLSLDVYVPSYAGYALIKTPAGQAVYENCWQYGFIIRYPYAGEKITGIPHEPWHIRYVGYPHAEYISKNHITLEEYIDGLNPGEFYQIGDYLVSRQKEDTLNFPKKATDIVISPDNTGYYIITGLLTPSP